MEIKDWIILIVPIIFNGFCLVIFEKYIEQRFNKINQREAILVNQRNIFLGKLEMVQKNFYLLLQGLQADAPNSSDLADDFCHSLYELCFCTLSVSPLLDKEKDIVYKIAEKYNSFVEIAKTRTDGYYTLIQQTEAERLIREIEELLKALRT